MDTACPYCDDPAIQERTIVRTEHAFAFPTNIPIVPMHILIAPTRHVALFSELSEKERNEIFDLVNRFATLFEKKFGAEGFNFAWNQGKVAGQSVPHFHLHVLPRKEGDTGITEYEPRKFLYRPGSREVSEESELHVVAEEIRKAL